MEGWAMWQGSTPSGANASKWGVPELWWYGKAKVFACRMQVAWHSEDATSFRVEAVAAPSASDPALAWDSGMAPGCFGVALEWGRPLEEGYDYRFVIRMTVREGWPDWIAVNDTVVWRMEEWDDSGESSNPEIQFDYQPAADLEKITIYMVKIQRTAVREGKLLLCPPHQGQWHERNLLCLRRPVGDRAVAMAEKAVFTLPVGTVFTGIDPHKASSYYHDTLLQPMRYNRPPLPTLPFAAAQVTLVERIIPPGRGGAWLAAAGVDGASYQPGDNLAENVFWQWADAAAAAGVKHLALSPVIALAASAPGAEKGGVEVSRNERASGLPGEYRFFHLHSLLSGGKHLPGAGNNKPLTPAQRMEVLSRSLKDMAEAIRYWLDRVPDGTAYFFAVELNGSFGTYKGGIADSLIGGMPGYDRIAEGGTQAWELAFRFFRELKIRLMSELGEYAGRVRVMANFDRAAFQGAYAYHSGVDLIVHKNIHRQSLNVVVANSRGAAHAYSKQYGFHFDAWDRNYWYSYHPREIRHGLMVYFHAGASCLLDGIPVWHKGTQSLSGWSEVWLDFCRYVRTHPALGEQFVEIAIMRGLGDEWNRVAGPSASWEAGEWLPKAEMNRALGAGAAGEEGVEPNAGGARMVPAKWAKSLRAVQQGTKPRTKDTYLDDYQLLGTVFAEYGTPSRTDPDRLCTGTPYGPVDFIPWDTACDRLARYRVIAYFGRGAATDRFTLGQLQLYVHNGGTLLIAAGQLRDANGRLPREGFLGVAWGEQRLWDSLPYTLLSAAMSSAGEGGEIRTVVKLPNGDPSVVKARFGSGVVYLFCGEWLTYWGYEAPRDILKRVLEKQKLLEFDPPCDWLEYMIRRKGKSTIFPLFHHGRGYFPSNNGKDYGEWEGRISVSLEQLAISSEEAAVFRVTKNSQNPDLPVLVAVKQSIANDRLTFHLRVEEFEEIVIGPKDEAEVNFYQ
jgi:hypothetical protein